MEDLQQDVREFREDMRELRNELREEIRTGTQRILDALITHEHDSDGHVFFRVPPTSAPSFADDDWFALGT